LLVGIGVPSRANSTPITVNEYQIDDQTTHIEVNNSLVSYVFSTAGGTLQSAYLYFAPWGTAPEEIIAGTKTDPRNRRREYTPGTPFPFQLTLGPLQPSDHYQYKIRPRPDGNALDLEFFHEAEGLKITKHFTIHNDASHTIDLTLTVQNLSAQELSFTDGYQLTLGANVHSLSETAEARYFFNDQRTPVPVQGGQLQGVGFVSGYALWLITNPADRLRPYQRAARLTLPPPQGEVSKTELGVQSSALTLAPGQEFSHHFRLYTGRVKFTLLELVGLQYIADMSWWDQILVPVANFFNWLYRFTLNYAWAILLFTILTRVLLFPLTRTQYHSMAKMVHLQPRMQKLQQRYPNLNQLRAMHPKMSESELKQRAMENRQELSKKMMELYRKEGVNPLGGCLPLLLQFPILILLWQAITYSAEQIHLTPGFLWMPDLALADPYYIIVILTVAAMIVQSKMTPMPSGQQNQVLIWLMPIAMGVFLKDFPAGLWIYYFLSTVAQVGQQLFINWELQREARRKAGAAPPAATEQTETEDHGQAVTQTQEAPARDGSRSQS
jgi:YidC/Oxa1 family membrane protein insertase